VGATNGGPVRRAALVVAVLLVVAAACDTSESSTSPTPLTCDPPRSSAPGTRSATMPWHGVDRSVEITVPPGYDGTTPAPLILNLHGFGWDGHHQDVVSNLPAAAGDRGYVVVSPTGDLLRLPEPYASAPKADQYDHKTWWNYLGHRVAPSTVGTGHELTGDQLGADDIGFLGALVDRMRHDLCIDGRRVFVTGFSNGAGMSATLACDRSDMFAAAAPVSGVNINQSCAPSKPGPVPILAIHGTADPIVPFGGGVFAGLPAHLPTVRDRMAEWATHDGCEQPPTEESLDHGVHLTLWDDCVHGGDVELFTIDGWSHDWPGSDPGDPMDATAAILDFFDAHPKPGS
jgi:polyhydroxybutyrate depolymerase